MYSRSRSNLKTRIYKTNRADPTVTDSQYECTTSRTTKFSLVMPLKQNSFTHALKCCFVFLQGYYDSYIMKCIEKCEKKPVLVGKYTKFTVESQNWLNCVFYIHQKTSVEMESLVSLVFFSDSELLISSRLKMIISSFGLVQVYFDF